MTQFDIDVCNRVAALMEEAGYGIGVKLHDVLGCSTTKITEIRKAKKPLKCEDIVKLSNYFGVSTAFLLTGEDAEPEPKAVDTEEKEGLGVPEVLDALQVLLETLEPAIKLIPYQVQKTKFKFKGTEPALDDADEEYIESAFVEEDTEFKAIGISIEAIQEMLDKWEKYKEATAGTPGLKDLFREKIFEDEIQIAKEVYDGIEPMSRAFTSSSKPMAVIRTPGTEVPFILYNPLFKLFPQAFYKYYGTVWLEGYPDGVPSVGPDYEIRNETRNTFILNGYTLESLDKALVANDLSKLERSEDYEEVVKNESG